MRTTVGNYTILKQDSTLPYLEEMPPAEWHWKVKRQLRWEKKAWVKVKKIIKSIPKRQRKNYRIIITETHRFWEIFIAEKERKLYERR